MHCIVAIYLGALPDAIVAPGVALDMSRSCVPASHSACRPGAAVRSPACLHAAGETQLGRMPPLLQLLCC